MNIHNILEIFEQQNAFGRYVYGGEITLEEANIDQNNLMRDIRNFSHKTKPQLDNKIQKKSCS